MSMIKEFRDFAMRGNVVDMAVGVIIGGAFGKIVSSLVSDIIMPPIGMLLGGVDFANLEWVIKEAVGTTPAVSIKYGLFLNTIVSFSIVAFAMFMIIRGMNSLEKKEPPPAPAAPPKPSNQELLLMEIRDALKRKG